LVNPSGSVTEVVPNLFVAHEPSMEGVSWKEHVKKCEAANPEGVVIDIDTILESERPMATFFSMMMERVPDCPRAVLMLHAEMIAKIVERNLEEKHKKRMEELEEKKKKIDEEFQAKMKVKLEEIARLEQELKEKKEEQDRL
jgi:hypothetical protein